jgi:arylesterase / paraoxonase
MRRILFILLALAVLIGGYVLYLARDAGEFRQVLNVHPGDCRQVPGLPGSEDITIHPSGRYAYISSDDRRSVMAGRPVPGAIFGYDLTESEPTPVNLTPDAGTDFRPHGISLHVDDDGRETLFVVNHPGAPHFAATAEGDGPDHTIEIFDVTDHGLQHRLTISDELLISPNDIVAVDHQRFYFSNDHGSRPGLMRTLEGYLRLPLANVVYFDGEQMHPVAEGLSYANGINLSLDGNFLYVAEVTRNRVREYRRDPASGNLEEHRRLDIGFGVDNIEVDPDSGDLWIGGHVKLLTFVRHVNNPDIPAPSQVVRVELEDDDYRVFTEFMDDGHLISATSVGTGRNGRLLVGSVFDPHIVDCRRSGPEKLPELAEADLAALHVLLDDFLAGASINDRETHEHFWADDLVYTSSSGLRFGKADILSGMNTGDTDPEPALSPVYSARDVLFRDHKNSVVLTFRLVAENPDGEQTEYFNTGVLVRRDGRWQVTTWQATLANPEQTLPY